MRNNDDEKFRMGYWARIKEKDEGKVWNEGWRKSMKWRIKEKYEVKDDKKEWNKGGRKSMKRRMNDEGWSLNDEGWKMKNEVWRVKDEGWRMKDEGRKGKYTVWSMKYEG